LRRDRFWREMIGSHRKSGDRRCKVDIGGVKSLSAV
jgi:hypothetical protein